MDEWIDLLGAPVAPSGGSRGVVDGMIDWLALGKAVVAAVAAIAGFFFYVFALGQWPLIVLPMIGIFLIGCLVFLFYQAMTAKAKKREDHS